MYLTENQVLVLIAWGIEQEENPTLNPITGIPKARLGSSSIACSSMYIMNGGYVRSDNALTVQCPYQTRRVDWMQVPKWLHQQDIPASERGIAVARDDFDGTVLPRPCTGCGPQGP